jgi:NAD(P)-dependent dehydrogenase (short-subunit alcohol dehydrogenase family)
MPPSKSRLIVITGISRGLGKALAEAYLREGHTVAGCARSAAAITGFASRWPAPHHFAALDVADAAAVDAFARDVLERLGTPDLILNNAAIINPNAPVWEVSPADFGRVIDVNIKGVAHVLRSFLPAMNQRRSGIILNFSSGWGRSTSAEVAPYCATKWAIEGLSQAVAQEVVPGVCVAAVNPGIIDTDMLRSCFGSNASSYPSPDTWARRAAPYFLKVAAADNGQALTAP